MTLPSGFAAKAALAVLIAAGALKVARYTTAGHTQDVAALDRIEAFLSQHGWTGTGETWTGAGGLYTASRFTRPICDAHLTIAILSASEEAADLARRDLGDGTGFVQDGAFVARPGAMARQTAGLMQWLRRVSGRPIAQPLPIIAVSPGMGTNACASPAPALWKAIDSPPDRSQKAPFVHDR